MIHTVIRSRSHFEKKYIKNYADAWCTSCSMIVMRYLLSLVKINACLMR